MSAFQASNSLHRVAALNLLIDLDTYDQIPHIILV